MPSVMADTIVDETASEWDLRTIVQGLIRMLRPMRIGETGAYRGGMTEAMGQAAQAIGAVRVFSCEPNEEYFDAALTRCLGLPVSIYKCPSSECSFIEECDFLFLDSDYRYRADEIARAKKGATIVIHDAYKSYDPNIEPLAPLIEQMGGVCFRCGIDGRGFGILVKK